MLLRPGADSDVCVEAGDQRYTRREIRALVAGTGAWLRGEGLAGGDRVLALLDHDIRGVAFLAAASALGLRVMMPYNLGSAAVQEWAGIVTAAKPDWVADLKRDPSAADALRGLGPRVVRPPWGGDPRAAAAAAGAEPLIEHPDPVGNFLVLFTSGTTGAPKAISISERLVCRRVASVSGKLGFHGQARIFMSGLLSNTTGVFFSFGAMLRGATLVFPANRDIEDWPAQVARSRATHIMLRPVSMARFVASAAASGADLSSVQCVAYGAAAMPRAVLEAGRRLMPCAWVLGYGLSETYGPFCWLDEEGHAQGRYAAGAYCVGRPDETLEVRLAPVAGHRPGVGEVTVRGSALMEGYLDVATGGLTPPGEWLRTGDLAEWSPDGDLLLKGRVQATLLSANGHRVYPEEVEAVLITVPGVEEALLVGANGDDAVMSRPVACLSGPLSHQDAATIRAAVTRALGAVLSREKWPDLIYPSPGPFPKSANDKVLRAKVTAGIDDGALIEL